MKLLLFAVVASSNEMKCHSPSQKIVSLSTVQWTLRLQLFHAHHTTLNNRDIHSTLRTIEHNCLDDLSFNIHSNEDITWPVCRSKRTYEKWSKQQAAVGGQKLAKVRQYINPSTCFVYNSHVNNKERRSAITAARRKYSMFCGGLVLHSEFNEWFATITRYRSHHKM